MGVKDLWTRASKWMRSGAGAIRPGYQPEVDDQGLIAEHTEDTEQTQEPLETSEQSPAQSADETAEVTEPLGVEEAAQLESQAEEQPASAGQASQEQPEAPTLEQPTPVGEAQAEKQAAEIPQAEETSVPEGNQVVVTSAKPIDKAESLEKLQAGFNELITQLKGINENLKTHAARNAELMARLEQLPKLIESFPAMIDNQKQFTERLFEQLRADAAKQQQFTETVAKIPAETAKQTDALVNIDHQLAAAADTDAQIAENFNKFNEALAKLNEVTAGQTDSIMQMSRTFATSDRYLKYIISRDKKRFAWLFVISLSVCTLAILILVVIIWYLSR